MRNINCIIVDDEPLAREGLARYIGQVDFLDLKAQCKNALEANVFLHRQQVDLIFLDIEMPQLSGIHFLESLPQSPWVIFTTAYAEYALEGYQFNTADYLVKPISFERFLQAVNKALKVLGPTLQQTEPEAPDRACDFLFIKVDKQLVRLQIDDICYIEGMQNYIAIFTAKERLITMSPMKNLLELLPAGRFLQVHKSYIVAKNKVERIDEGELVIGSYRIPLSRRMREDALQNLLGEKMLRRVG